MRNLKKFLALVLAMMMTLSLMVTVNASSFKDVEDTNTYVEAIDMLAALGVLRGQGADADGEFQPKGTITRAEMAAVLYRVVTGDVKDKNVNLYGGYKSFTDLNDGAWYIPYVNYCENNGLINGVGGGKFEPQEKLTGYQALVMILRAMGYNNPNEFSSSDWKLKASGYGRRLGITNRIEEGSLGAPIAREAVAEIVFQAIQKPTVSYNMLLGYTNDVLVAANKDKDGNWIYDHDVYNTLLYQVFGIVGKRTVYGGDGTYGRPMIDWVKDAKDDTVANGGKYIVNPQAPTAWANDGVQNAGVTGGLGVDANAVYIPTTTPGATYAQMDNGPTKFVAAKDKTDQTVVSTYLAPVYTFNTAMTECELTKVINGDKSIQWRDIEEYVNGGIVKSRHFTDATPEMLDALHTTNTGIANKSDYTIGAQGRQTEIYKLGDIDNDTRNEWIFVYIDTMLGEVVKVVPKTVDTAGHIVTPAELHVAVNDSIKDDDAVVLYDEDNYTQKKGDKVLLTTWGLKDNSMEIAGVEVGEQYAANTQVPIGNSAANPVEVNEYILDAVPDDTKATDNTVDDVWSSYQLTFVGPKTKGTHYADWTVDLASDTVGENATVPTTTVTVDATLGFTADKTGIIAGGKNIYTTWAYHVDQKGAGDATHTGGKTGTDVDDVDDDTMLTKQHTVITNQIIGQTYTAALDKNGNIVGMWPGSASTMVGVLTDADYARIGLGKYAVEFEIFTTEEKTETVRMLNAADNFNYFPSQEAADAALRRTDDLNPGTALASLGHNNVGVGSLVKLESYVRDGATYWKMTNVENHNRSGSDNTVGKVDSDSKVIAGRPDTLKNNSNGGATHTGYELNNDSVIFVAEYDFRYNQGSGNQGANYNVRYKVYDNFRNIPCIDGAANNIMFQVLDYKAGDSKYCLINAYDPDQKYTLSNKGKITVDDSFLVVAPIATYAEYSEYSVAKNGELTTIKVSNVNNSVNAALQAAIRTGGLMRATGINTNGYITEVKELNQTNFANDPNLMGTYLTNTMIEKNTDPTETSGAKVSKGVLSFDDAATTTPAADTWITVADNCVVKIVNVDNGKLYDATLDNIEQYNDHLIVFELDADQYVSCLYIID